MPTSTQCVLAAIALAAGSSANATEMLAPERFQAVGALETSLVGLAVGIHPEVIYRPLAPDGWLQLRAGLGVLAGPELYYLPVTVGIRGLAFPRRRVHPGLGIGGVMQNFVTNKGGVSVTRWAIAYEASLSVTVAEDWQIGIEMGPEIGMFPGFGLGMAGRIALRRGLPWTKS